MGAPFHDFEIKFILRSNIQEIPLLNVLFIWVFFRAWYLFIVVFTKRHNLIAKIIYDSLFYFEIFFVVIWRILLRTIDFQRFIELMLGWDDLSANYVDFLKIDIKLWHVGFVIWT